MLFRFHYCYSPTQIHIFNDLLDLLYKYVDKSNTMDISVNDVIRNLLQIISTKTLPIDPSVKLIVFINSLSKLSDDISNFIFVYKSFLKKLLSNCHKAVLNFGNF